MARVCVILAEGFEEIEAVTIIDVLRRAEVDTRVLGLNDTQVEGSHGITLRADGLLADESDSHWDAVILPGGLPGSNALRDSQQVQALLLRQHGSGGIVGAICAAPIALSEVGILEGLSATSNPSHRDQINCGNYLEEEVVVDGTVVTSRAVGTAMAFALRLVGKLTSADKARDLGDAMLVPR